MVTIEQLDVLVRNEFTDELTLKNWENIKLTLDKRFEPEYMDADRIEWVEYKGYSETYDEEIAYFLWKCGCTLFCVQDRVDGSPEFTIYLPDTEDEYIANVKEGTEFWESEICS